jgi:hypothetical protein
VLVENAAVRGANAVRASGLWCLARRVWEGPPAREVVGAMVCGSRPGHVGHAESIDRQRLSHGNATLVANVRSSRGSGWSAPH